MIEFVICFLVGVVSILAPKNRVIAAAIAFHAA
jgi:cbb3-type cytochrome oxidase subunit 3